MTEQIQDVSTTTTPENQSEVSKEIDLSSLCGIELLEKAAKNYKENGKLKDEDMLSLHWIFGPLIISAFEMIDNECVHAFESPTDRYIVRVLGSKGDEYWIPIGTNQCQCISFRWKKDICKHIIAAHFHVASMTPHDDFYMITDEELNQLYTNILSKS